MDLGLAYLAVTHLLATKTASWALRMVDGHRHALNPTGDQLQRPGTRGNCNFKSSKGSAKKIQSGRRVQASRSKENGKGRPDSQRSSTMSNTPVMYPTTASQLITFLAAAPLGFLPWGGQPQQHPRPQQPSDRHQQQHNARNHKKAQLLDSISELSSNSSSGEDTGIASGSSHRHPTSHSPLVASREGPQQQQQRQQLAGSLLGWHIEDMNGSAAVEADVDGQLHSQVPHLVGSDAVGSCSSSSIWSTINWGLGSGVGAYGIGTGVGGGVGHITLGGRGGRVVGGGAGNAFERLAEWAVEAPVRVLRELNRTITEGVSGFLASDSGRRLSEQVAAEMSSGALMAPVYLTEELVKARLRSLVTAHARRLALFFGLRVMAASALLHAGKGLIKRCFRKRGPRWLRACLHFACDVLLPTGFFGPLLGLTAGLGQLTGAGGSLLRLGAWTGTEPPGVVLQPPLATALPAVAAAAGDAVAAAAGGAVAAASETVASAASALSGMQ